MDTKELYHFTAGLCLGIALTTLMFSAINSADAPEHTMHWFAFIVVIVTGYGVAACLERGQRG
jgi:hypothetical protein